MHNIQVEAHLIIDGMHTGQSMRANIPDLPDPRIEELELQVLAARREAQEAKLQLAHVRWSRRAWWRRLIFG